MKSSKTVKTTAGPVRDRRRKPPTFTVAFRMGGYHLSLLEKGAAPYNISVHEYARQRLSEVLEGQEAHALLEELQRTREEVNELREDVARLLEVLLVNLTRTDAKEVRTWIDANLRRD